MGEQQEIFDIPERFSVVRKLADASVGPVYLVKDSFENEELKVVKVIESEYLTQELACYFVQRSQFFTRINHSLICPVREMYREEERPRCYIVMDYVTGLSLERHFEEADIIHSAAVLELVKTLLKLFLFLHTRGYSLGFFTSHIFQFSRKKLVFLPGELMTSPLKLVNLSPDIDVASSKDVLFFGQRGDVYSILLLCFEIIFRTPIDEQLKNQLLKLTDPQAFVSLIAELRQGKTADKDLLQLYKALENVICSQGDISCADLIQFIESKYPQESLLNHAEETYCYSFGVPMVSCVDEQEKLTRIIRMDKVQIVTVVGADGAGKTMLIESILSECGGLQHDIVSICCLRLPGNYPNILIRLLHELVYYVDDVIIRRYRILLKQLLPLHDRLRFFSGNTLTYYFKNESDVQERVFELLTKCLTSSNRKKVFVIENCHVLQDSELLQLDLFWQHLSRLAEATVLCLTGHYSLRQRFEKLQLFKQNNFIHLGQLSTESIDQVLAHTLGRGALDANCADNLKNLMPLAKGTMQGVIELLRILLLSGTIVRRSMFWEFHEKSVPLSLTEETCYLLGERLAMEVISGHQRELIKVLCFIRTEVGLPLLNTIIQAERRDLQDLFAREILSRRLNYDHFVYGIRSESLRREILKEIPDKVPYFDKIASRLEVFYNEEIEHHVIELSHYFLNSSLTDKAAEYAERAAQEYIRYSNYGKAFHLYDEAIERSIDEYKIYDIEGQKAELCYLMQEYEKSLAIAEEILEVAREHDLWQLEKRMLLLMGQVLYSLHRGKEETKKSFEEVYDLSEKKHDHHGMALSLLYKGNVLSDSGEIIEAGNDFELSLSLFEKIDDLAGKSSCLEKLIELYGKEGDFKAALHCSLWQEAVFRELKDEFKICNNLYKRGTIYYELGNAQKSNEFFHECRRKAEILGEHKIITQCIEYEAHNLMKEGRLGTALKKYKEALYRAEIHKDEDGYIRQLFNIGEINRLSGKREEAKDSFNKYVVILQKVDEPTMLANGLYHLGLINIEEGEYITADSLFKRAIETLICAPDTMELRNRLFIERANSQIYQHNIQKAASIIADVMPYLEKESEQSRNVTLAHLVEAKIMFAQNKKEEALRQIGHYLKRPEDKENIADIHYLLAMLNKEIAAIDPVCIMSEREYNDLLITTTQLSREIHIGRSYALYRQLNRKKPYAKFRRRIGELEKVIKIANTAMADVYPDLWRSLNPKQTTETVHHSYSRIHDGIEKIKKQLSLFNEVLRYPKFEEGQSLSDEVPRVSILEILTRLSSKLNLTDLLEHIIDSAIEITQAERGFVLLIDDNGTWSFAVGRNVTKQSFVQEETEISKSAVDYVLNKGQTLYIRDTAEDSFFGAQSSVINLQLLSIICLPLKTPWTRKMNGIMYLDSDSNRQIISESSRKLLEIFAQQAALSIENAQLYRKSREDRERLKQINKRLQETNEMKSKFIGLASHELKTPLTILTAYLHILKMKHAATLEPHESEILVNILETLDKLNRSVNRVSDIVTLTKPILELKTNWFSVAEFILQVRKHVTPFLELKKQDFSVTHANPELWIRANQDALWLVLLNILLNAIRYTPDGGRIHLAIDSADGRLKISVQDNGIGVPETEKEKIFRDFYRLQPIAGEGNANLMVHSDLGMGLTIASLLIEIHKGEISVESTVDVGSTFYIDLPIDCGNIITFPFDKIILSSIDV